MANSRARCNDDADGLVKILIALRQIKFWGLRLLDPMQAR